jgi:hypothetical protein
MNIEAEVKVELRINEGRVPAGRRCGSGGGGERGVMGGGDGVTESVLIRIQQDARGEAVLCTTIRVESEDVWSDDALDVKVRWTHRNRGGCCSAGG